LDALLAYGVVAAHAQENRQAIDQPAIRMAVESFVRAIDRRDAKALASGTSATPTSGRDLGLDRLEFTSLAAVP